MVSVGDKVFVAPLYNQKDNLAVITGPAGAAGPGGIIEGNYNTWTYKWEDLPSNGISQNDHIDILIDEENETLSIVWEDTNNIDRFGIYNISDFSVVFESSVAADHTRADPDTYYKGGFGLGMRYWVLGGVSQSLQTYLLLLRDDKYTIEVWRGGASALWTGNAQTDLGANCRCYGYGISLLGKYLLLIVSELASPYTKHLMLYEGSSV